MTPVTFSFVGVPGLSVSINILVKIIEHVLFNKYYLGDHTTGKDAKGDQSSGGAMTWTNNGETLMLTWRWHTEALA